MKVNIFLKQLSETSIDKLIINDSLKAGDWGIRMSDDESWFFSFTNYDDSSNTGNGCR
jgi:hypothetical protein